MLYIIWQWKTRSLVYKELKDKCRDKILVFNAWSPEKDKDVFKQLHSSKFGDNYTFIRAFTAVVLNSYIAIF